MEIDLQFAAILRNCDDRILPVLEDEDLARFLRRIDFHGIACIMSDRLPAEANLPDALRAELRERVVRAEMWELEHRATLATALSTLDAAGITPLLLKGTAVAYRHYERPAQRMRGDTDILVARTDFERAIEVLVNTGGQASAMAAGPVAGCARHVLFEGTTGTVHEIDVHHDLNGHAALRGLFDFEALAAQAVQLPGIAPTARAPSDIDTLLIAVMHRLKHRQSAYYVNGTLYLSADRLIWLMDIHCLAESLGREDWEQVVDRARTKGLTGALLAGLEAACEVLGAQVPERVLERLAGADAGRPSRFLEAGVLGQMLMDLRAMQSMRDRIRFLSELAFPPADHMRSAFGHVRPNWLPWLYLYRAGRGTRVLWSGDWGGAR